MNKSNKYELIVSYGDNHTHGVVQSCMDEIYGLLQSLSPEGDVERHDLGLVRLAYRLRTRNEKAWVNEAYFYKMNFYIKAEAIKSFKSSIRKMKIEPLRFLLLRLNERETIVNSIIKD